MVDEGVTFTPLRGSVDVRTDASVKIVQELTKVIFEITPQHEIYMADEPEIFVKFPQAI